MTDDVYIHACEHAQIYFVQMFAHGVLCLAHWLAEPHESALPHLETKRMHAIESLQCVVYACAFPVGCSVLDHDLDHVGSCSCAYTRPNCVTASLRFSLASNLSIPPFEPVLCERASCAFAHLCPVLFCFLVVAGEVLAATHGCLKLDSLTMDKHLGCKGDGNMSQPKRRCLP